MYVHEAWQLPLVRVVCGGVQGGGGVARGGSVVADLSVAGVAGDVEQTSEIGFYCADEQMSGRPLGVRDGRYRHVRRRLLQLTAR